MSDTPKFPSIYEPKGTPFFDGASRRDMLLVSDAEPREYLRGWLCYRHPDGQWVTLRKASDADRAALESAPLSLSYAPTTPSAVPVEATTREPESCKCGKVLTEADIDASAGRGLCLSCIAAPYIDAPALPSEVGGVPEPKTLTVSEANQMLLYAHGIIEARFIGELSELRSRLSLLEQQTAAMRAENELLMVANEEQWAIAPQCNGGWVVCETNDVGISGDADEGRELSRTRGTLTEALTLARASLARDTNQETTE